MIDTPILNYLHEKQIESGDCNPLYYNYCIVMKIVARIETFYC